VAEQPFEAPKGITSVGNEVFYQEFAPRTGESGGEGAPGETPSGSAFPTESPRNQLF